MKNPKELEPVLAKIKHQGSPGEQGWMEVVYFEDGQWCSYDGSDTFENAEQVVRWVYAKDCLSKDKSIDQKTKTEVIKEDLMETFQISEECDLVKKMLMEKNRKYGNSALNPLRFFSTANSLEQIKIRIDDKLSRIKSDQLDEDEDVIKDLIGYFILLLIAKKRQVK